MYNIYIYFYLQYEFPWLRGYPSTFPCFKRPVVRVDRPVRGLLLEMLWSALPGRPFPTVLDMVSQTGAWGGLGLGCG